MILEMLVLMGLIIFVLLLFAELTSQSILGVFASVLMLISAFWILTTGITYQTGQTEITAQTSEIEEHIISEPSHGLLNETQHINGTTILSENKTKINTYSPIPTTPFIKMDFLLGFSLLLLAIYALVRYISTEPGK